MTPGSQPLPLVQDLVLIGGGHTHALVLKSWGMSPLPGARLTLINPAPTAPYTGMLPGFVAGHYDRDALEIDLVRLARFAGARLIIGAATALDSAAGTVTVPGHGTIAYDVASIDIGITSDMPDLPGFADHGLAAKPLGPFAARWQDLRDKDDTGAIAVIGAGVAGVELALAMHHDLSRRGREPRIALIDAGPALAQVSIRVRQRLRRLLAERGIALHEHAPPEAVTGSHVTLANGEIIPADHVFGAAGARPWPWLAETGLALEGGYLAVDARLRTSDASVFAAGDCAHLTFAPRPKAGVFAVRAAPTLAHNLRAALSGGALRRFRPQSDYLKLISLGGRSALGEKWGISLEGGRVWQAKDRIDRAFMDKLSRLAPMPRPAPPRIAARGLAQEIGAAPPCGGCGAKVGPGTLSAALSALPRHQRDDVTVPPGDDAALIGTGAQRQVVTTDHLRAFTEDPATMARITALHALGDIWAMGARPQAALATVILPRMSTALQSRWLDEIMGAAGAVLTEAGAVLAGGHTTLGPELTLGFAVTGLVQGDPITLAGARPGDALILTRAIGSGTLLAGEMQMRARGPDVAALLAELQRPQGSAARLLSGAHAMTDVTGFGLAGHLLNMSDRSGCGMVLEPGAVPLFPGAAELAAAGIRSTIYPDNLAAAAPRIQGLNSDDPASALLFDPQTAGGLLAAVPAAECAALLGALGAAGHPSARIGEVTGDPPGITLR